MVSFTGYLCILIALYFEGLGEGHSVLRLFQSYLVQMSPKLTGISWSPLEAAQYVLCRADPLYVYSAYDLCFHDYPSGPT